MKRRIRILLTLMLTGIWLCVQSPFAHAQRMQLEAQVAQPAQIVVEDAPCHGEHAATTIPADTHVDDGGCCEAGHCDGQCMMLSWALAAPTVQLFMRGAPWLSPFEMAGVRRVHQPEPFRPPI
jgi:hypothetical protein